MTQTVAYVLDTLNYQDDLKDINGNDCKRIAWECSCLQKICGACGMLINGKPGLACCTYLDGRKTLVLEPLSKFPVMEDLIVDKSIIFENLKHIQAWLDEDTDIQNEGDSSLRYDCAKCMKCGLCLEVCPNYRTGKRFFGATAVPEAFLADGYGNYEIKGNFDTFFSSGCSKSGACEKICPAGIKTLSAMASLNRKRKDR
jgi:succinate dehydrogenase / fumarate reductase iron-sulfur subunit